MRPDHKHDEYVPGSAFLLVFVIALLGLIFGFLGYQGQFKAGCAVLALERQATSHTVTGWTHLSCNLTVDGKAVVVKAGDLNP
jgi:hypothetical protein